MDKETVMILIALVGCFVGLCGWLSSRDKKICSDSEWRGTINGKLDALLGISTRVDKLEQKVEKHGEAIAVIEQSTKSAHHRIDEFKEEYHEN